MRIDKKLPTDTDKLKSIAEKTDNPQLKRSIEDKLKKIQTDKPVEK